MLFSFSLIFGRISATSYLDNVMVAKGETDIIDFAKLKPSTLSIVDQFVKSTLPSSTKTAQNQKVKDKKSKIKAEIEEMPARECFRHGLVVRKKLLINPCSGLVTLIRNILCFLKLHQVKYSKKIRIETDFFTRTNGMV